MTGIGFMPYQQSIAYSPFSPTGEVGGIPGQNNTVGASSDTARTGECQTCANRKYQDGSDEMVSFKSAQHISPQASASRVMAHEMEHVSNAFKKAAMENGKVLQASVRLKTALCPECGRAYVSGGVTNTRIQYSDEKNPYIENLKKMQSEAATGNAVDIKVG